MTMYNSASSRKLLFHSDTLIMASTSSTTFKSRRNSDPRTKIVSSRPHVVSTLATRSEKSHSQTDAKARGDRKKKSRVLQSHSNASVAREYDTKTSRTRRANPNDTIHSAQTTAYTLPLVSLRSSSKTPRLEIDCWMMEAVPKHLCAHAGSKKKQLVHASVRDARDVVRITANCASRAATRLMMIVDRDQVVPHAIVGTYNGTTRIAVFYAMLLHATKSSHDRSTTTTNAASKKRRTAYTIVQVSNMGDIDAALDCILDLKEYGFALPTDLCDDDKDTAHDIHVAPPKRSRRAKRRIVMDM